MNEVRNGEKSLLNKLMIQCTCKGLRLIILVSSIDSVSKWEKMITGYQIFSHLLTLSMLDTRIKTEDL